MNEIIGNLPQGVFARSFGSGARPVLAVHCSLAHSGAWRALGAELESEATLHGFDLLSHGRSPDWDGEGILQLRNRDAGLALIDAMGLADSGPIDLVGHSFGATVALAMAQARPELVRSLTMIEPVLFASAGMDDPAALEAMREAHLEVRSTFAAGDLEQATRLFNRAWGTGHPKWADLPEQSRAAMMRSFPGVMACDSQVYDDEAGLVAEGQLEKLQMPVMVIDGSETQPIMHVVSKALSSRIGDVTFHRIAGAGHMVPITHASDVAELLRAFWN